MTTQSGELTDDGKLLFAAGFAFGVMATLVLLGVVLAVVTGGERVVPAGVAMSISAGVVFAAIVGAGLYVLAFPETRTRIPVDESDFGLDGDE